MDETTRYLLVGGGVASVWAAENIRQRDADGIITIVGMEKHPPYDRPPLSKQALVDDDFVAEDAYSKDDSFYSDKRVRLHTGVEVTRIDREARAAHLSTGAAIRFEKLLLATGSTPRPLKVPGADLSGVLYLRTIDESEVIRTALQHSRRAVVIGAGYMGMEVASGCAQRGLEVTVIEPESQPWAKFASPTLGAFLQRTYEARGVRFLFGEQVSAITGEGRASGVTTSTGQQLPADVVIACVGVTLNTDLAREAGLELGDRGGVMVDETLQTADPNIWAAGDIACFQDAAMGKRWHAEHFLNAKYQGRAVGAIMAGERKPYDKVPYFFSDVLDIHMALRGDPSARKETKVVGDLAAGEFAELYPDDQGRLRMGVAISHEEKKLDPASDRFEELIRAGAMIGDITPAELGF